MTIPHIHRPGHSKFLPYLAYLLNFGVVCGGKGRAWLGGGGGGGECVEGTVLAQASLRTGSTQASSPNLHFHLYQHSIWHTPLIHLLPPLSSWLLRPFLFSFRIYSYLLEAHYSKSFYLHKHDFPTYVTLSQMIYVSWTKDIYGLDIKKGIDSLFRLYTYNQNTPELMLADKLVT